MHPQMIINCSGAGRRLVGDVGLGYGLRVSGLHFLAGR